MDVAMMQPTFLPWQGFFELIHKAQIFIFLDDFFPYLVCDYKFSEVDFPNKKDSSDYTNANTIFISG